MYTITLANGTKLTGLDMNGTNYVSKEKVDETIFKDNLSTICLLYTSPSPRDRSLSRMPSSA